MLLVDHRPQLQRKKTEGFLIEHVFEYGREAFVMSLTETASKVGDRGASGEDLLKDDYLARVLR